jgi:hypothetical protein
MNCALAKLCSPLLKTVIIVFIDHADQNNSLDEREHSGREFDARDQMNEIAKDHSPAAVKWYPANPEIGEKHGHEGY